MRLLLSHLFLNAKKIDKTITLPRATVELLIVIECPEGVELKVLIEGACFGGDVASTWSWHSSEGGVI